MSNSKQMAFNAEALESESLLVQVLAQYLTDEASERNRKYFVFTDTFVSELANVVQTMEAIRSTVSSTVLTEQGDSFFVSDYLIPTKLHDYLNSGRIYATAEAMQSKEPFFTVPSARPTLAPHQFNAFWSRYNGSQYSMHVVACSAFKRESCTLETNVQYVEEGGTMWKLHDGGYSLETCSLIKVPMPKEFTQFLTEYAAPSKIALARWLSSSTI